MEPGFIPLAVRTCLGVLHDIGVHPGPPEVPPHKLDCLFLFKVSGHFAVVFGFKDGEFQELGNVDASSVVENVVGFHCQMLRWFDINRAIWFSAKGTQT